MAKTIDDCLDAVRVRLGEISGLRAAPAGVPEAANIFPFAVAWVGPGEAYREEASTVRYLGSIVIQLHFSRRDLYQAEQMAAPYVRSVYLKLLANPTLGGACDTFERVTNTGFQPMAWGDPQLQTVGYEFRITGIKVREASATVST